MSTPKYVLTYTNHRGLAEIIRLIFKQAEVDFENKTIKDEEWKELKPNTPFGHIPLLTIDGGEYMAESRAIARYLARKHDLVGSGDMENFQCDMHVDAFYDLFAFLLPWYKAENDTAKRAEILQDFVTVRVPSYMKFLEPHLLKNNGGVGYLVGAKLTWADLAVGHGLHDLADFCASTGDIFATSAKLKLYADRIVSEPRIAKWMATRTPTEL